jgi:hypothetical protein
MAKLTKKQIRKIESALYHAKRARTYLYLDTTAVCRRSFGTTTEDYIRRKDGAALAEVAKEYGSDLCGIDFAIKELQDMVNEE